MTHIDNVPHILRYGITHRLSLNANQNYIPIGDSSIINKRNNKVNQTIDGQEFCTFVQEIIYRSISMQECQCYSIFKMDMESHK